MTTFDQALASRGLRYGEFLNLKNFNASGSDLSTTGAITSGSNALTLASDIDFEVGLGIVVYGAGAVATVQQPTGASATPGGTTGATTYNYRVSSVDSYGGVGPAIANFTTTTGNATTSVNNFVALAWTAPAAGPAPKAYAVWRDGTFIGLTVSPTFTDNGIVRSRPSWVPASPPAAATSGFLVSSVASGSGTSLVLANNAATTVSGATVQHDDSAAVSAALTAAMGSKKLIVPDGTYLMATTALMSMVGDVEIAADKGAVFKSNTNLGDQLFGFSDPVSNGQYSLYWRGGTFDNSGGIFGTAVASNSCLGLTRLRNVVIESVHFKGASSQALASQTTDSGLTTVTVTNLIVQHCIFEGQGDLGIYLSGGGLQGGGDDGGENLISDNIFVNCGVGVAVKRQLPRVIISNNSFNGCFQGISLLEASSGPAIDPGRQCLITGNILRKCIANAICIHAGAVDTADGSGTGITAGSRTVISNNQILDFGYLADGVTAYNGSAAYGGTISGIAIQGASQCFIHGNMIALEDWVNGGNGTTEHKAIFIDKFTLNSVNYAPDKTIVSDNYFINVNKGIVENDATVGPTMAMGNVFTNVSTKLTYLNAASFSVELDSSQGIRGTVGSTETWRFGSAGIFATRFRTFLDSVGFTKIARTGATLDFGTVSANSTKDLTVTVSGILLANGSATVCPQASNLLPAGISYTAYVTANGTVTVRAANHTTSSIVVPSGSFLVYSNNIS
jgi:hypothetical protein